MKKILIPELDSYDYVYDMKVNKGHTNESLAKLFNVSTEKIKHLVKVHNISKAGISRTVNTDKLDLTAPILSFTPNTITKVDALKQRLYKETAILDVYPNADTSHRYYFLKNSMTAIPKCVRCNKNTSLDNTDQKKVFQQYCSHSCNSTRHKIAKESLELVSDYEWMYDKRIVKNMSYENIAELANTSYQVIVNWIGKLDIDNVKYQWNSNKSIEEIKVIRLKRRLTIQNNLYGEDITKLLHDHNFLYDQYITKRKPST